jgi:asparagine synthase (glutamine-hydrolysing)
MKITDKIQLRVTKSGEGGETTVAGVQIDLPDGKTAFVTVHGNCQHFQQGDNHLFLHGECQNLPLQTLIESLDETGNLLNRSNGHFAGILIRKGEKPILFAGRFGARTWYYRQTPDGLNCSTDWKDLVDSQAIGWDPRGLAEIVHFRWLSDSSTLFKGLQQLPFYHVGCIEPSGVALKRFWKFPPAKPDNSLTFEKAKIEARDALSETIKKALTGHTGAAVLLSGGTDSSVLAALAKSHVKNLVAYSAVFEDHGNPELETAKRFAETLDIPHKVICVNVEQIEADLRDLVRMSGAPLRHYSSLVIHQMFRQMPDVAMPVLYGEGADTLFGYNGHIQAQMQANWKRFADPLPDALLLLIKKVFDRKRLIHKLKNTRYKDILPMFCSMHTLKHTSLERLLLQQELIRYRSPTDALANSIATFDDDMASTWHAAWSNTHESMLNRARRHGIAADIPHHFKELELSAMAFNKRICGPFHEPAIHELSARLTKNLRLCKGWAKPILREIACDFYPRELIYQRKWGFPVPQVAWLDGPLKPLVEKAFEQCEWDIDINPDTLQTKQYFEFKWLLLNFYLLGESMKS